MNERELKLDREQGELRRKERSARQLIEKLAHDVGRIHIDPAPDPEKGENDGVATVEDPRSATRALDVETKRVVDAWIAERIGQLVEHTPKLADRIRRRCGYRPIRTVIVCENGGEEYWRKFWFRIEPN